MKTQYLAFLLLFSLLVACKPEVPKDPEPIETVESIANLSGNYYGTASLKELIDHSFELVLDTSYNLQDWVEIVAIDTIEREYELRLHSQYRPSELLHYKTTLHIDQSYTLSESYYWEEGINGDFAYSYARKIALRFIPEKDSISLTLIYDPPEANPVFDSLGMQLYEEFHRRTYILKAER